MGRVTASSILLCLATWACSGASKEPGRDAGADQPDGGEGERDGAPDGRDAGDDPLDAAADAGIPLDLARILCARYVECVSVTTPVDLAAVLAAYGPDGSCWDSGEVVLQLCGEACRTGLAQGRAANPGLPECAECEANDHCLGGSVCGPTGFCVECVTDNHCGAGLECRRSECVVAGVVGLPVDLLVVVDNSLNMSEEQADFVRSFPDLLAGIVEPADGAPEDLHIGVISTDMGSAGHEAMQCSDAMDADGDDGVLLHTALPEAVGCAAEYPTYLSWQEGADPAAISADFGCIATLGTTGCGYEQHLNAMRAALGEHANGANAGFLRDDSLLAIVILSEEDDCSIPEDDPVAAELFNQFSADLGHPNLRCYTHPEYLAPISVYAEALLSLRPDPSRLVIAGIVGIPPDTGCDLEDYDCLLAHGAMQTEIRTDKFGAPMDVRPTCEDAYRGTANPPRRIVELIRSIDEGGGGASVATICQGDLRPTAQSIAALIRARL